MENDNLFDAFIKRFLRILGPGLLLIFVIILIGANFQSNNLKQIKTFDGPRNNFKMVWIPGGKFMMGSNNGDSDEKPIHQVHVKGFWLSKYEITNKQYGFFLFATNHHEPPFWDDPDYNQPNNPVIGIKWNDVIAFCKWAKVRLPTEVEWEYAAAAGSKQLEYGTITGKINHDLANFAGRKGADCWENTSPVGNFPPNPFGLYDMAGNALEWCSSLWEPYPYMQNDGRERMDSANKGLRIMRGGSWHYGPDCCRVTARHYHREHLMYDYVGFRVALNDTTTLIEDKYTK